MYIDTVRLTNIRGFQDLHFSFCRGDGRYAGWTVLTGGNGSGKSTLLKALTVSWIAREYGVGIAQALQPNFSNWIHHGKTGGTIELYVATPTEKTIQKSKSTSISIDSNASIVHFVKNPRGPEPSILGGKINENQPSQNNTSVEDNFACSYGPFRRIFGASPDISRQMAAPQTERFVTLFQESASLIEADQWLRQLNYKRLEGKAAEAQALELVVSLLNDEFLPNQIRVNRVDSDGLWLEDRNRVELSWSEMSDGYRSALALLTDILRHLINHYGIDDLTARDAEGKLFITRSGVVLIDEIDAHLHPEWQREIGFWLKKRFPNIQFIVTSHSPLICQAADPNGLFVLPEPGSDEPARALTPEEYQEVISSRPDTILRSAAFGFMQNTRSPVAVEARSAFADLRTKQRAGGKLTKTELAELERLRQYINPDEEP